MKKTQQNTEFDDIYRQNSKIKAFNRFELDFAYFSVLIFQQMNFFDS